MTDDNIEYSIFMIIAFVLGISVGAAFGFKGGYESGQKDALCGKYKYSLTIETTTTVTTNTVVK